MSLEDTLNGLTADILKIKRQLANLPKPEYPLGLSLISESIVSVAVASITFSDIPQTFRHLQLICQARTSAAAETDVLVLRMNGDTAANYDIQALGVNNATLTGVVARANTSIGIARTEAANSRANNFGPAICWVYGYALTDREKWTSTLSANFGDVSADADLREDYRSGRWRNVAAITSLTLLANSGGNLAAGSRFQLYGLK